MTPATHTFPVHDCGGRPDLPRIRGNLTLGRWEGEGCPPGCDMAAR